MGNTIFLPQPKPSTTQNTLPPPDVDMQESLLFVLVGGRQNELTVFARGKYCCAAEDERGNKLAMRTHSDGTAREMDWSTEVAGYDRWTSSRGYVMGLCVIRRPNFDRFRCLQSSSRNVWMSCMAPVLWPGRQCQTSNVTARRSLSDLAPWRLATRWGHDRHSAG